MKHDEILKGRRQAWTSKDLKALARLRHRREAADRPAVVVRLLRRAELSEYASCRGFLWELTNDGIEALNAAKKEGWL